MVELAFVLALALGYQLSWLLTRRKGFSGVTVLIGWLALAAAWVALSQGPVAALAAGLAAAAAWAARGRWLYCFERPAVQCPELGGRLRMTGLGYGAVLQLEVPGARAPLGRQLAIWIEGIDVEVLRFRHLREIRQLLQGANRVSLGGLRQLSGHLHARVYADGRDVAALLAEAERPRSRAAEPGTPPQGGGIRRIPPASAEESSSPPRFH